ncbi:MAG: histidine triad (HIT) family protein [Myxococcota bacterium]|jgi:histidine triad (HIT) family protein
MEGDFVTIFARIISGEIPADKVYEDEHVVAFRDVNPQAPVHVLVVPREPLVSVAHAQPADAELLGRLLLAAARVAEELGLAEGGYRLVTNVGRHGGQSVFHLHIHLLGGRQLGWPPG